MAANRTARRFDGLETEGVLGFTVPVATRFRIRLVGLALLRRERAGEGLLIPNCRSVHTFGMRFELDVLFLARGGEVIERRAGVPPGRLLVCRGASCVLELPC